MIWFLLLLSAAAALVMTWPTRRRTGLAVAGACCVLSAAFWPGRFWAEKMLTDLAMPLGAIWLALLVAGLWSMKRRARGLTASFLGVAAAITVGGNGTVADVLIRPLEAPYRAIDPFAAGPLDAVCVLGGGLSSGPGGRIMSNDNGDRVLLGARLYHAGVSPRLVCTGRIPSIDPSSPSLADMTKVVWSQLGVPSESITTLPGENTSQEITELKRLATDRNWSKVGLVTSAWHMGRAERLAVANHFRFVPLPADFRSTATLDADPWLRLRTYSLIPNAGTMSLAGTALKEYLARLVGR